MGTNVSSKAEISLKFPYLTEKNIMGLKFEDGTASTLATYLNHNDVQVQVTWYNCMEEYLYAIGNTTRYVSVDIQFKVGEVTSFDPTTGMLTMLVKETHAADMSSVGRVVPRCVITKIQKEDVVEMKLERLICIDVIIKQEENTNESIEVNFQNSQG